MDAAGTFGWVCEGDKAPCFELPDTTFTSVSPIGANTKVRWWGLRCQRSHMCQAKLLPLRATAALLNNRARFFLNLLWDTAAQRIAVQLASAAAPKALSCN